MPAGAAVNVGEQRGGTLRAAIAVSVLAHVMLLIWVYQWAPPEFRAATIDRIIPIFVTPRPVVAPPPAPETAPRTTEKTRPDPGGRTGAGEDRPAVPIRQPDRIFEPERTINVPVVRNPDPDASTLVSSAGSGQTQGDGAGPRPGPGQGLGTGTGPGVGPGASPGGVANAPAGWTPEWRKLPTREQVNGVYPKAAWDKGVSGGATLLCTLRTNGRVTDCTVIKEAPPGQGFGRAVLMLSRHFRITPRRENGKAVETRLAIPYMMLMDPNVTPKRPPSTPIPGASAPATTIQAPAPRH